MKVTINESVTKNIPQEYASVIKLMPERLWDEPDKIRLSPTERLRLAEYVWRSKQDKYTREYIGNLDLLYVVEETNRKGEIRYIGKYTGYFDVKRRAKLPKSIAMIAWSAQLLYEANNDW